jgi:hypothetical protein
MNNTLVLVVVMAWCVSGLAADKVARGELKIGFSQVDITPPAGAIITGPSGPASTGTDDPLRARAMVVQSGDRKLAIVGVACEDPA